MKIIYTICCIILAMQSTSAQLVNWAKTGGGFGNDEIHAISTQPSGTSYIGGNFYSPCNFDTSQLLLPDTANAFIAKIDNLGTLIWVKYFPTPGNSTGTITDVAAAWDGGCFMTGSWTDSIRLDSTLLIENGSVNTFFSRLDQNGTLLWIKQASGTLNYSGSVVSNYLGDVYFTGKYYDSLTIDSTTIINTLIGDGSFIVKFDSTGQFRWLKNIQGSQININDIAIDNLGSIVITGRFSATCIVDTTQLISNGSNDLFIAKYDTTGQLLWVRQDGGGSEGSGNGISICPNNDILICGSYTSPSATFDTITIPYLSGDDFSGFVARYNQDGNVKWVNYQSSINGDVWNYAVKQVTSNTIYFSGFFYDSLYFSNGSFMETGPASYLAACDQDGNMIWVKKFAGGNFNFDFSLDSSERIYISGIFLDSIIVTPYQFNTQGQSDFFFAQLASHTVGIQHPVINSELTISPNPSNGNIILRLSDANFANSDLQVFDGLGVLVMQQKINQNHTTRIIELNLDPGLKSGIYTILWMNKDKRYSKRIVIHR